MPQEENTKNQPASDFETDAKRGSDAFRESPELKFNKGLGPKIADSDSNSVTRPMPRFAEDDAYMFGRPNQLGKENVSDFRPDQLKTDGKNPMRVIPEEDNSSLTRDSLFLNKSSDKK
jgi:hypothetical protein